MTRSDPQPSKSRDKIHRTDAGQLLQKDRPETASKDERDSEGRNSAPDRQGQGVDERGRYARAASPTTKTNT